MKNLQTTKPVNLIKYGTIIQLGKHRITCGDARDKELVSKLLKGYNKVSLIASDVPYGVSLTESKSNFQKMSCTKAIANDHLQTDEEYIEFTKDWLETIKPYLADYNSLYIFNSDKMVWALREGLIQVGCKLSQLLIWVKTQSIVGRLDYSPQHELIIYGWYGKHKFKKSKDRSVIVYPKPQKSKLHPTMKPLGLMRRLILNSSDIGDVVYDGFLGSGSTLLSCEQTKRICVGVELDPEYCQVIIDRFQKISKEPVKIINI